MFVSVGPWAPVWERWFLSVGLWLLPSTFDQRIWIEESIDRLAKKEREERQYYSNEWQRRALRVQRLQTEKSVNRSCSIKQRSVFLRLFSPTSSAPSSVERSVLRLPIHPASKDMSSVECLVLRIVPPSYVERSIMWRALSPPLSVPSSVGCYVLRRAFRPLSSAPYSVDQPRLRERQEYWDQRSVPETAERDAPALDMEEQRAPTGSYNKSYKPCVLRPCNALY